MSFLKNYFGKYWKQFSAAVACLTVESVCDLLQPAIMAKIVDIGVKNYQLGYITHMGMIMLCIALIGAGGAVGRNIISSIVSQQFGAELRLDIYKKIHSLSMSNIDKFERASLITRLTNDVVQVQNFVNGTMRIFFKAPLLCIGGLIMASLLNLQLALVLIGVVPVIGVLVFFSLRVGYPFFSRVQKALDKMNSVIREYLSGIRVVKAFNRSDYESVRFNRTNEELVRESMDAMRIMAVFAPCISLCVNIGIVAVLWLGGLKVSAGSMQVGQIIAFINYMTQILFSLMLISHVFMMFIRAKASGERIQEILREETGMPDIPPLQGSSDQKTGIDFEHVFFSYDNSCSEPVLKDITFSCKSGQVIGIIGSTGSGKSSLANLVPRFYDTVSGCVKVNGIDVREIGITKLRERIAVVPQKPLLFTGTILENICWGRMDADFSEIEQAARASQAHEFIVSFPEGYNTQLGQGGVNLSGGQKQRISIARALVKNPEILILDDCTSSVDVLTEAKIRESLKDFHKNMACLVIAQRITSVMNADRIIVLDRGEIAGEGKHSQLMEDCEVYRDIYRSQFGKEMM